ncbi:hypothetical protein [Amycolatopsis granulosa]|uniref:hypothetical protein n=1 Tax=Amycolatopsis granulosa TaxID=185684 RepID=UPI00141F4417|nr:hypothetical protein [Amycolatopsis granulosa]NIH83171.1 hypothetical protein [Amycolatopsis granulosa]
MGVYDVIFGLVLVPQGLWMLINPVSARESSERREGGGFREFSDRELLRTRATGVAGILIYVVAEIYS